MRRFLFLIVLCFISHLYGEHSISFIIPCYNCEEWISEAIDSIYTQELKDPFEIICTDDGSTDSTYDFLLNLAAIHPEMKVFQHEKNQGGGAARNTCVKNSIGDLIFCLDADNILTPNSVQKLIDYLDEHDCNIVSFGMVKYFINDLENVGTVVFHTETQRYVLKDIVEHGNSPGWSGNYLFTRKCFDAVDGYPTQWGALDTFTFSFLKLVKGFDIAYVPDTYYWHRHGIESYFIRDSKAKKITYNMCLFLLENKSLFTKETIKFIHEQLKIFRKSGDFPYDYCWFFENKKIVLR